MSTKLLEKQIQERMDDRTDWDRLDEQTQAMILVLDQVDDEDDWDDDFDDEDDWDDDFDVEDDWDDFEDEDDD